MTKVELQVAQSHLEELVAAALQGEMVWIMQDAQHAVQLVPAYSVPRQRKFGSAKGLVTLAADFDAPLADFGEYTS